MAKFSGAALLLLMVIFPSAEQSSQTAAAQSQATLPAVGTYDELLSAIRAARASSRERVETFAEAEKIREAWETGKLIDAHVLLHKKRADYGKQVLGRLADDLSTDSGELSRMLQFYRAYPIFVPAQKLSWSHYQALLSLNDPKELAEVAEEASRQGWTRDRVRQEVRRRLMSRSPGIENGPPSILVTEPGTPGIYRIVKAGFDPNPSELVLDLGFSNYLSVRDVKISTNGTAATGQKYTDAGGLKEGDIVILEKGKLKKIVAQQAQLFTFNAAVLKVIDGDTFAAAVDLGFGITTVQTLRLRGLDAPEIFPHETSKSRREALGSQETSVKSEGEEAKEFLVKQLAKNNGAILIKTVKSDKYDRYLADVFAGGQYVNQQLVEKGFAVPVTD